MKTDNGLLNFYNSEDISIKLNSSSRGQGGATAHQLLQAKQGYPARMLPLWPHRQSRAANKWIKRIKSEHKGFTHVLLAPEFHKE